MKILWWTLCIPLIIPQLPNQEIGSLNLKTFYWNSKYTCTVTASIELNDFNKNLFIIYSTNPSMIDYKHYDTWVIWSKSRSKYTWMCNHEYSWIQLLKLRSHSMLGWIKASFTISTLLDSMWKHLQSDEDLRFRYNCSLF